MIPIKKQVIKSKTNEMFRYNIGIKVHHKKNTERRTAETINEFCKMYHISHQAVYATIRRHGKELKNHISKNSNGVKILDDNAVNFLKPKKISTEMYNSICEENDKLRVQNISLVSDNENLQKHISAIESQMQKEKTAS